MTDNISLNHENLLTVANFIRDLFHDRKRNISFGDILYGLMEISSSINLSVGELAICRAMLYDSVYEFINTHVCKLRSANVPTNIIELLIENCALARSIVVTIDRSESNDFCTQYTISLTRATPKSTSSVTARKFAGVSIPLPPSAIRCKYVLRKTWRCYVPPPPPLPPPLSTSSLITNDNLPRRRLQQQQSVSNRRSSIQCTESRHAAQLLHSYCKFLTIEPKLFPPKLHYIITNVYS